MSDKLDFISQSDKQDLIVALRHYFFSDGDVSLDRPFHGFGTVHAVFGTYNMGYNKCRIYSFEKDLTKVVVISHDKTTSQEGAIVKEYVVIADSGNYIEISTLLNHLYEDLPKKADITLTIFESRYDVDDNGTDTKLLTLPVLNSDLTSGGKVSNEASSRDFWYIEGKGFFQINAARETKFSSNFSKDLQYPTWLKVGDKHEWLGIDLSWTQDQNASKSTSKNITNILFIPAKNMYACLQQK